MRDLLIALVVTFGCVAALRRPWIGVLLWTWIGLFNPHKYAYGFSVDAPLAAAAAVATGIGLVFTRERASPFKGEPVVVLFVFMLWITLSWAMGLDPRRDFEQWLKVMKIDVMLLVTLALLHSKKHIFAFAWVVSMSLGVLGAKGGLFTLATGGGSRVWGPSGTFIAGNNEFALALVVTIPLLRFLQMQLSSKRGQHVMTLVMLLCAVAALGSHSRGALLALSGMAIVMWWRGRNRFVGGVAFLSIAVSLLAFMPENWTLRMATINSYEVDPSALGRLSAWSLAWNAAFQYPFGVGFNATLAELFERYSIYGLEFGTPVAHSIYFQVLGHHGFVGLALFLLMWIVSWWSAGRLRKEAQGIPEARWCFDLAGMCQVALVGYLVGGAFLSLAYLDLPYYVMILIVVARVWVRRSAWTTETIEPPRWRWLRIPGLAPTLASKAL